MLQFNFVCSLHHSRRLSVFGRLKGVTVEHVLQNYFICFDQKGI